MVRIVADNIFSPLGCDTEANLLAVREGRSALRRYEDRFADVEPFVASLFDEEYSFVELCLNSARQAIAKAEIDLTTSDTVLILSTTKGDHSELLRPAEDLAKALQVSTSAIVVSNACTSGVCALITAQRLLESGAYKNAIVVGAEQQTRFIVSGFQSFKALSAESCHPFSDIRDGLNVGEAAATMVLTTEPIASPFVLAAGSIHNDANHISGPSRTAEGSLLCIEEVTQGIEKDDIAFVSLHGTATPYNDEMESIAIHRAGLDDVPVCGLKGYYGHTMGAAGVVESIITMHAAAEGWIPPTCGYTSLGTTYKVNISKEIRKTKGQRQVVKLLSGFGGTNAAVRVEIIEN